MHPGPMYWWKRAHGCGAPGAEAECCPSGAGFFHGGPPWARGEWSAHFGGGFDGPAGGPFGVRRPLRFLAYKLELDEPQVAELARILNELKTERAQAAVDDRRAVGALADTIAAEGFDAGQARNAAEARVQSAAKLRDAVVAALGKIHALLTPDQRKKLSYLIQTGTLAI